MHRFIGLIVLLALTVSARGQSAYSYRYWFDDDLSTLQEGSAQGKTAVELDIGMLAKGRVHALHVQGLDARNKWGVVRTQHFIIPKSASTTTRYWYDDDDTTVQTAPAASGVITLDISHLSVGIHAVHFQTLNAEGETSPVHSQFFFVANTKDATARYWFDSEEQAAQKTSTVNGLVSIDISQLPNGIHALHYQTFDSKGEAMPVRTQHFYKKNELELASLTCRLWIDDDEDKAMTFGLTENIVVEADGLAAGSHTLHVVLLNANGEQLAEKTATFEVEAVTSITIALNAPIVTFSNEKGLDFGNIEGLKAYTATSFHRPTGNVLMSRVNDVPAGEGLLLVGEPGTYEVPILKSYSFYANLLVGTPEAAVIAQSADGYDNYLLSFRDGEPGFFLADDGSISSAGKAYLHIPSDEFASAKKLRISFDDHPDGIVSPSKEMEEGAIYNLSGQRLSNPQKGLNIINGHKVVIK